MKYTATITHVLRHTPRIVTLYFSVNDTRPADIINVANITSLTNPTSLPTYKFTAGQYLSVYFDETGVAEGKAYSISATPWDDELAITVKNVNGPFSSRLCDLKPGDNITISSPFGFFNVQDDAPIVAIAAGVGISPILSIIRDECHNNPERKISLFFTAPKPDELVFSNDINKLFKTNKNASVQYFVTRQPVASTKDAIGLRRRFSVDSDISEELCNKARFYVCGSEDFVRDIFRSLMERGVNETNVVTETFFESA